MGCGVVWLVGFEGSVMVLWSGLGVLVGLRSSLLLISRLMHWLVGVVQVVGLVLALD